MSTQVLTKIEVKICEGFARIIQPQDEIWPQKKEDLMQNMIIRVYKNA